MDVNYLDDPRYPDEEWRFVPEFERYLVSSYGRVFNTDTHSFLSGRVATNGSIRVRLFKEDIQYDVYIHQLVADLFTDEDLYSEIPHVIHRDGDKTNNHISNLEVVGPFRDRGVRYQPEYRGGKLVRIVETGEIFPNVSNLAIALETDTSSIYKCLRGERQKHLGLTYEYVD